MNERQMAYTTGSGKAVRPLVRAEQLHRRAILGDFGRFLDEIREERDALEAEFRARVAAVLSGGSLEDKSHEVATCWQRAIAVEAGCRADYMKSERAGPLRLRVDIERWPGAIPDRISGYTCDVIKIPVASLEHQGYPAHLGAEAWSLPGPPVATRPAGSSTP